jgi:hypothetical protein
MLGEINSSFIMQKKKLSIGTIFFKEIVHHTKQLKLNSVPKIKLA